MAGARSTLTQRPPAARPPETLRGPCVHSCPGGQPSPRATQRASASNVVCRRLLPRGRCSCISESSLCESSLWDLTDSWGVGRQLHRRVSEQRRGQNPPKLKGRGTVGLSRETEPVGGERERKRDGERGRLARTTVRLPSRNL